MRYQGEAGNLIGEDSVPIPPDAVLIFESDVPELKGNPLMIRSGANSIKWSYQLNTSVTPTIGGEVVQVLSAFVGPMTIQGLTAGYSTKEGEQTTLPGWTEESFTPVDELMEITEWFLTYMQAAGLGDPGAQFRDERAVRFRYPVREWDFRIWITALNGFRIAKDQTAVPWSITAEIMSDNALDYFQGTTMASMQGPLNDKMLQVAITPGYEFAHNPFVNPALAGNDPNKTARNLGAQFQGLIAAWTTGDFMTWGFSSLAVHGGLVDYNKKALPTGYQKTTGLLPYWGRPPGDNMGVKKEWGVGGYWVGSGGGHDYVVDAAGYKGPGHGPGGGGDNPPSDGPPGGGGQPPGGCGDSSCYNKTKMKIKDKAALAKAIDDWMESKKPGNPLTGQGSLIVSLAEKYNLNPLLYPVVAFIESTLGTDCCHHDNSNHNTWGDLIGGTGGDCVVFGSFTEATQAYFKNLATNSAYSGDSSVCDVIGTASPADDNPGYMDKFLGLFGDLIDKAGDSIDCSGGAKPPPQSEACDLGPVTQKTGSIGNEYKTHDTSGLEGYPAFDTMGDSGDDVIAPEDLIITRTDSHSTPGSGLYATGASGMKYWFGHLNESGRPNVGDHISKGEKVGTMYDQGGNTHVHLGIDATGAGFVFQGCTGYKTGGCGYGTLCEQWRAAGK